MTIVTSAVAWLGRRLTSGGRPLRFVLAGGVNTLLGLALYPALLLAYPLLRQHYVMALMIAQAVCLAFAFITYKLFVFRTQGMILRELTGFAPYYLVNYGVNIAVLPLIVNHGHIDPIIAQLIFSVVLMIGSYFWHKYISFRSRGSE